MTDYIRELAKSIIGRLGLGAETKNKAVDGQQFLIEEGIDLLASLRTIQDKETRLLLKRLIDAVAECHGNVPPRQS